MFVSPKTLLEFKQEVAKFKKVVDAIAEVWPSNKITMISVMLQNLAFSGVSSVGYSHENDCQTVDKIIHALIAIEDYDKNDHTSNYIINEVYMTYQGYLYGEDYEEMMNHELDERGEEIINKYHEDIF